MNIHIGESLKCFVFSLKSYVRSSFHIDITKDIFQSANSRDEELESILTHGEEECDIDSVMEKGNYVILQNADSMRN